MTNTKTAAQLIDQSVSQTEIAQAPRTAELDAELRSLAEDWVDANEGVREYWGTREDGETWRVHLYDRGVEEEREAAHTESVAERLPETTMINLDSDSLSAFGQCPEDAGQMIDVHYAVDWSHGLLVCRTHDRSDRTTTYQVRDLDDEASEEESEFEPQNSQLPKCIGEWRTATIA